MYMIGMTIIGSIILYPVGLAYIDALFFAAGAATQSGLNTVNVNDLATYQQITLIIFAMLCNPVFINTMVVFVRLYWFEKRFQGIVRDAIRAKKTKTRSRSRSEAIENTDPRLENGVNGRQIRVLHNTTKPNGMKLRNAPTAMNPSALNMDEKEALRELRKSIGDFNGDIKEGEIVAAESSNSSQSAAAEKAQTQPEEDFEPPVFKREITFADEIKPPEKEERFPSQEALADRTGAEHHIAFLERQRKKDQGTLRIPGPRDFERGDVPRELDSDEEEDIELRNVRTRDSDEEPAPRPRLESTVESVDESSEDNRIDQLQKRNLTFNEPRRPDREDKDDEPAHKPPRFNILHPFGDGAERGRHQPTRSRSVMSDLRARTRTFSMSKSQDRDMAHAMPYLSWQPTIGRNSMFVGLTEEQREELGGIEYRSLKTLAIILVCYFLGFSILGIVVLLPWIVRSGTYAPVLAGDGQSRAWWGVFTPLSMFTDLGFTLTPDSMISFQTATLPLLFGSFLIIIGNTGFPCMLRFCIWVCSLFAPKSSGLWEELRFLLDHPRRCFTLLFPSRATWWLFWILVLLNGIDLVFFIILDLNDEIVTSLPPGYRVLDGWFQAVSTRTAGFSCVNLAGLHPAIQVSYLIMMYISVFPIAISVRRTNVYEEKSLGIYAGDDQEDEEGKSYVGQHLRRQLSFDLWYIFLGLFIIAIVEGGRLENTNEYAFTLFSVLFEIVSAYGTVGLSLGYPTNDASLSAEFAVLSKLIIVAMMIRGRHRGLPYALDRAILLPSENLEKKEAEEASRRSLRRPSFSVANTTGRDSADARSAIVAATATDGNDDMYPRTLSTDFAQMANVSPTVTRRTTMHSRRGSDLSQMSRAPSDRAQSRATRRLSTFLASGFGAGPTNSGAKFE
ncbi:hypothetical protein MBLNU457_6937t1 [Dothideomycetes sp. NU457]